MHEGLRTLLIVAALAAPALAQEDAPLPDRQRALAGVLEKLSGVEEALEDGESLESALVRMDSVGAELDIFELRFGIQPRQVEGWDALSRKARALLKKAEAEPKRAIYFNRDSAAVARAVLLDLSGESEQAMKALKAVKPGGGCGNWIATVLLTIRRRLSGIQQRRGDYTDALASLRSAGEEVRFSLYFPRADVFYTRYGYLELRCKQRDEGLAKLQKVVDLFPGSPGASIAARLLKAEGAYKTPTAVRLQDSYDGSDRERLIFALARHGFPESLGILTRRLPEAKGWERNRLIPALGILGDPRAIPALREAMAKGSFANATHGVSALHSLGDEEAVARYLDRLPEVEFPNLGWAQRVLESLHDGGPSDEHSEPKAFADAWRAWLAAREPATPR